MESSRYYFSVASAWLLVFVLMMPLYGYTQTYTLADTVVITRLYRTASDSVNTNTKGSLKLIEEGISISKQLNLKKLLAKGLKAKGAVDNILGHYDEALTALFEAKQIYAENDNKKMLGGVFTNIAAAYNSKEEFGTAMQYLDTALNIFSGQNDTNGLAHTYGILGGIEDKMNDYDKSTTYYSMAIEMFLAMHDPQMVTLSHIAITKNYIAQKKYPEAVNMLRKAEKTCDSMHLNEFYADIFTNMGVVYSELKKNDSALYFFLKALPLARKTGDGDNEALLLGNIGALYVNLGKAEEAEKYLKEGLQLAKKSSNLSTIYECRYNLGKTYYMKGDYGQACLYKDSALIDKDSLFSQQRIQALSELTTKYETREIGAKNKTLQKENDLQKLLIQRKNILLYSSVGAAILFLIIGIQMVRQNRLKANQQKMELEQKQLLAQINPHFIFNCLNSIQQFVVQNDIMNANKYLADFALLMRQTLDNSKDGTISLRREIEYLENYLSFEHMRFEDKFVYAVQFTPDLNIDVVEIPSMIIQPFVENAIRHGLINLETRKGLLKISFYKNEGFLFCEVDDNGIGMEEAQKLKGQTFIKYQSHGMELTRQRLALVSKMHSKDYTIKIVNKAGQMQTPEGTTIILKFPLQA